MDSLVVVAARYLLVGPVLLAGVIWPGVDRAGRVRPAAAAVVCRVASSTAGALHVDWCPLVLAPSTAPLFPHPADSGSPSGPRG